MPNISGKTGLPTPDQLKAQVNAAKKKNERGIDQAVQQTYVVMEKMLKADLERAVANVKSHTKVSQVGARADISHLTGPEENYDPGYFKKHNLLQSLLGDELMKKLQSQHSERDVFTKKFKEKAEKENPGWTFEVNYTLNGSDANLEVEMYIVSEE